MKYWNITTVMLVFSLSPFALTATENTVCHFSELNKDRQRQVKALSPVRDQLMGSCSSHATADVLSHFALDSKGNPIPLSADYLIALEVINGARSRIVSRQFLGSPMGSGQRKYAFEQNSTPGIIRKKLELMKRHGVVPTADWKPRIPVEQFVADGGLAKLFEAGGKYDKRMEALRVKAAVANDAKNWDAAEGVEREVVALLREALEKELGVSFSKKFVVEGRTYNPRTFENTFLDLSGMQLDDFRVVTEKDGERWHPDGVKFGTYTKGTDFGTAVPASEVKAHLRSAIDRNEPVLVTIPDPKHAANSGAILDSDLRLPPPRDRMDLHTMHVVGYLEDNDGHITHWKIKNSWGKDSGDEGFLYMTAEYAAANPTVFELFRRRRFIAPPPAPRTRWPMLWRR